jgi:cytochrome c peroxidase
MARRILFAAVLSGLASASMAGVPASADETPSAAALERALNRVDALLPYLVRKRVPRPGEVELGRQLFFDPRLSSFDAMSCATCHQPAQTMTDGLPRAVGHGHKVLARNTPTVSGSHYRKFLFWDGRAKSVEEAALTAVQNPEEMSQDLPGLARKLAGIPGYVESFGRVYGSSTTPQNAAAAIAAFIAQLSSFDSSFDRFHESGVPMTPAAQRGLVLFTGKADCIRCHGSPNFTSEVFYNVGLRSDGPADPGRFAVTGQPRDRGAFRVPSLRNAARTPPYMHDGSLKTLLEVVDFFDRGGDARAVDSPLEPLGLEEKEKEDLVAFLEALSSSPALVVPPLLPLSAANSVAEARAPISSPGELQAARTARAVKEWDGLEASIKHRVAEGERKTSPWSSRLPRLQAGDSRRCMETLGVDVLLGKALKDHWREKDALFVDEVLLDAAGSYYLFKAVADANPDRCAPLSAFDAPGGFGERLTLDGPCRERYYEIRLAQALQGTAEDRPAACMESLSHQPTMDYPDAGDLCAVLLAHPEQPEKVCATFQPAYLDKHQVRACANGLRIYLGEAGTCDDLSDLEEHLRKRCEVYPLFRRASRARDIELCGTSQACRVLMGAGKQEAAAVERGLTARACGLEAKALPGSASESLDLELDRAQRLLDGLPESWRESRIQRLATWRRRYAALRGSACRAP